MVRLFLALSLLLAPQAHAGKKKRAPEPELEDVGAQLLGRSLVTDGAWEKLVELCDDIGHRLSGTPQLEAAVARGMQAPWASGPCGRAPMRRPPKGRGGPRGRASRHPPGSPIHQGGRGLQSQRGSEASP